MYLLACIIRIVINKGRERKNKMVNNVNLQHCNHNCESKTLQGAPGPGRPHFDLHKLASQSGMTNG